MERLPLAANSVQLVWSNLALQWATDLEACLRGFHRVLAPGGAFVAKVFQGGSERGMLDLMKRRFATVRAAVGASPGSAPSAR